MRVTCYLTPIKKEYVMKKCKKIYQVWLVVLGVMSIVFKANAYSGELYFMINMVALAVLNIVTITMLLKFSKKYDSASYEKLKYSLLTRTNRDTLQDVAPVLRKEIDEYESMYPYMIANIIIVIFAELLINLT